MKNLIFGLMLLSLVGCNQKKSTQDNQNLNTESSSDSTENNSTNSDLPTSNYFKVKKINFMRYLKDGKFEMDFELVNNSNYKFSSVSLSAYITSKMKNDEKGCTTYVQAVNWKFYNIKDSEFTYNIIKKWQPHTIKHIYFICFVSSNASFDRTPDEIALVLEASAISVDVEKEGAFAKYDLLDSWKERQVKEGLR